jgi:hypothetical protein
MNDVRKYRMEDALPLMEDKELIAWAKLNEVAGPGFTWFADEKVMGCGGIRTAGIGEAWAVFSPEVKSCKKDLLILTRENFKHIIEQLNLWQVFATTKDISPEQSNFLEHLGFVKRECYVYIRK